MTASVKHLLEQAIQLPPAERAGLADELFESLHKPDAAIDALWLREAQNRIAAYRSGELDAVDAKQVFAELGRRI